MAAQSTLHLLGLPAELRNHIFELALTDSRPITIALTDRHLIHQECAGVFFSRNHFIVQSGAHIASPIGGRKSAYTIHSLKTFLAAVGPQNAKFLTAITFELSSIDPGYMSHARDVMDQHRRIVVLFKQLESLAIANPKWRLETSMTLSIKTHVDHTMLYKDARCLVNLPDSGGSLRVFRRSLKGDLGKTFGSQWNKEELQWAVKAVQRWEEMLTKRA